MSIPKTLGLSFAFCILYACEKVDVDAEDNTTDVASVRPTSLGEGTQSSPYTVPQIINEQISTGNTVWVIGYAVGSTYRSMSNALFAAETTYTSNILLAESPSCTNTSACIAIELTTTAIQQSLSLAYHPQGYRQCIVVCGQIGRYFGQPGIRNTKSGYWLPDFDTSVLDPSPTEWDEQDMQY